MTSCHRIIRTNWLDALAFDLHHHSMHKINDKLIGIEKKKKQKTRWTDVRQNRHLVFGMTNWIHCLPINIYLIIMGYDLHVAALMFSSSRSSAWNISNEHLRTSTLQWRIWEIKMIVSIQLLFVGNLQWPKETWISTRIAPSEIISKMCKSK